MTNILIPMAHNISFVNDIEYMFPKPLIEVNGKTIVEHVIDNFSELKGEKQFIFIVHADDCKKFNLDQVLRIITDNSVKIITISNETKGSACSAIMAIDHINNDENLIISNVDQLFDLSMDKLISHFKDVDAGVITFESVHPRWSYVKLNDSNDVVEVSEKRPISRNAIAGLYYYNKGSDFIDSALAMIKKGADVNNSYYIAPSLNQMILKGKSIGTHKINNDLYHTFYSPQKIKDYERLSYTNHEEQK